MIDSYLNQYVVLKAKTGYDAYRKPTTSTGKTIICRIQGSTKRIVTTEGKELNADAELWVKPAQVLAIDDLIVWNSENYKIQKIDSKALLGGNLSHKKALLIRVRE